MSIKLLFLGDISFNDQYEQLLTEQNTFNAISKLTTKSDYVIGNLECFCESHTGENTLKVPRLKTTENALHHLKDLNLDLVSLANNHAYDNLTDGFEKTVAILKQQQINYLGAGTTHESCITPHIATIQNKTFCFLNYVTHDTNPNIPEDASFHLNWYQFDKVKKSIKVLRNRYDYIILLLHWGGDVENLWMPNLEQPKQAKELIAAGADLIIGHHTHTFQPWEIINNRPVFYSIGNFCFDTQFKFENPELQNFSSGIVQVSFNSNHVRSKVFPIISELLEIKQDHALKTQLLLFLKNFIFKWIKTYPKLGHFIKFLNLAYLYKRNVLTGQSSYKKLKSIISKLKKYSIKYLKI
ncbi:hypothetical protein DID74_00245 [Candidatus Marinamargulisbacteria bacterium SCGC AG-333-B06]|nr:hypothetical protein DID74_00245 [Candidatus Marinamargulisbacteria bacterium SCGC AG-333-B06]